ncbi:hypothetical protein Droror1_Dr00024321 [Drosera rotundifolia]
MGAFCVLGATVAVECADGESKKFRKETKTNEQGEFRIVLPPSISKHAERLEGCEVKLVSSGDDNCAVASTAGSSSMELKSRNQDTHIFSTGFLTFKPLKQPALCAQKHVIADTKNETSDSIKNDRSDSTRNDKSDSTKKEISETMKPNFYPIQDNFPFLPPEDHGGFPLPTFPRFLPPLPELPPLPSLPSLPSLPPLPGLPKLPPIGKDQKLDQMTYPRRGNQSASHPEFSFPPGFPSTPAAESLPFPTNPLPRIPWQTSSPPAYQTQPIFGFNPPPPPPLGFMFPVPPFPPRFGGFPGFPPATASAKKTSP